MQAAKLIMGFGNREYEVRRNISSSFLGAAQNSQPDSITTDLLQEQSLKLTSVSGQLQNISRQN